MDDIQSLKSQIAALKKEIQALKAAANSTKLRSQDKIDYEESQVRFRTIFESSRLGNKIISSELVILQVNPAMVNMLGYSTKEEIIGTKIIDYTPMEFRDYWKELQESLWKRNSPSFSLETCLRKKDGSIIWCHVTSILFQDKGETLGYTIIEDITEQHQLRQQKEEFISVASHELKTPISTIRAILQLMNRMIKGEVTVTERFSKLAKTAEINTAKLGYLVVNLLDATKIEQGQLSLNKSKFKISELLEKCCTHIRLDGRHHITQTGDLSLEVCADEQKIDQVLINLVNNAVKYAPKSEEILIHVEQLNDMAKISVIDKGPGIPSENLPKLFERYYRVNNDGNHNSGLGLGLYISSEIIRIHSGQMVVDSEFGKGSTFWFTLPISCISLT